MSKFDPWIGAGPPLTPLVLHGIFDRGHVFREGALWLLANRITFDQMEAIIKNSLIIWVTNSYLYNKTNVGISVEHAVVAEPINNYGS